jgi:gluconokinase
MRILALEASTTSAKVVVFDAAAGLTSAIRPLTGAQTGQRDPDLVVAAVCQLARDHRAGRAVDLVTIGGTWHGLTLQRRDGSSLTPALEWPHTGARPVVARLRQQADFVDWYYRRTGCMVSSIYAAFKLRQLRDQGVDLGQGWVMDQASVLFQRLTSVWATTASLASGGGLLNVTDLVWDTEVAQALGVAAAHFPHLVDSHSWWPLAPRGAAALGLPIGTPVLAPGPDGGLTQVGDQASDRGIMTFSMGTSGALRLATTAPVFSPDHTTWCYRSPDTWLSGAATSGCGNAVDWARQCFVPTADFAAIESQLRAGARDVPVFLPFLVGERCPGWHDQWYAGFAGLQPHHDALDLYQSVLQGVVFNLRQCYDELVRLNGVPGRVRLSGGVLASRFWTQLTVDVWGRPLEAAPQQHSSALGAIRLGLAVLGGDAAGLEAAPARTLVPNPGLADYYQQRYAAYLDAYYDKAES